MLIKSGSNLELVIFSIPFHLDRSSSSYQFEKYLNIFQCFKTISTSWSAV